MTDSLLKIRLHNGLLHTQYKIENVPLETALHIGWFTDEQLAKDSEYRLKYTFSKKMRQTIKQAIDGKKFRFILENGPTTIAVNTNVITLVYKGEIKLTKVQKANGFYEIRVTNVPQFDFYMKFSEAFYQKELSQTSKTTKPSSISNEKAVSSNKSSAKNQKKNEKKPKWKNSKKASPVSIWAPDGSLLKRDSSPSLAVPKPPPVYQSNSQSRKCDKCQNLNNGNYCTVQKKRVNDDDVCSRFYRISIVLGGAINPR